MPCPLKAADRPRYGTQVARVGYPVERDDQWLDVGVTGRLHQIARIGIGVPLDPQRQALVNGAAGDPVQLGPARLYDRDASIGREHHRLSDPLVAVEPGTDVQRGRGHARAQGLQYRIAAGHQLGCQSPLPAPAAVHRAGHLARPGPSRPAPPRPAPPRPASPRPAPPTACLRRRGLLACAAARRCAGWPGRIWAGGVGPLPSSSPLAVPAGARPRLARLRPSAAAGPRASAR